MFPDRVDARLFVELIADTGMRWEEAANAQLAAHLHLTEATIKGYVSRVLTRLGCTNRTEAALLAQRAGLVTYE
ncbi:response regulator transcription factor [Micromonospora sp. DT44]|uniref:response regulator transcription factor n=1 Tax=Micromonospora sp. DT44 TaxID=3393439 RepID=UPI003CE93E5D